MSSNDLDKKTDNINDKKNNENNQNNKFNRYNSVHNIFFQKNNQFFKNNEKTDIKNNNINNNLDIDNLNKKNNIKNNIGRTSYSFKRIEPTFLNNVKKGVVSQSSNTLKNYENFLVLRRDDYKNETKKNNQKNIGELGHSRITEKFKSSSVSSDS